MEITARDALIATSVALKGNWEKIYDAVKRRHLPPDETIERLCKSVKSKTVTILDPDYPPHIKDQCHRPPFVLYYYGDLSLAQDPDRIVTFVGSRKPSSINAERTRSLCAAAAKNGLVVASGLARGIDTAAAEGSVSYPGKTIAIIGSGIERCYPVENWDLQKRIAANGLLLSEYPGNTSPSGTNFPLRNRILACISRATIVGEAMPKSGTMITFSFAALYNRDIGAFPCSAGSDTMNNTLIKNGAALIENLDDLLLMMSVKPPFSEAKKFLEDL